MPKAMNCNGLLEQTQKHLPDLKETTEDNTSVYFKELKSFHKIKL